MLRCEHEASTGSKDLVSSLEVADLAELSWPDQLRLAARMRLTGAPSQLMGALGQHRSEK